jgi:hypothetical protein
VGLELRGHTILSQGEFIELSRAMRQGAETPAAIVAWWAGECLSPRTLEDAFHSCAPLVEVERGHELLALALRRMNDALGRPEFCFDELPPAEPGEI